MDDDLTTCDKCGAELSITDGETIGNWFYCDECVDYSYSLQDTKDNSSCYTADIIGD